jgi:ATP-dependent Clp protease adapter protein ClpS
VRKIYLLLQAHYEGSDISAAYVEEAAAEAERDKLNERAKGTQYANSWYVEEVELIG